MYCTGTIDLVEKTNDRKDLCNSREPYSADFYFGRREESCNPMPPTENQNPLYHEKSVNVFSFYSQENISYHTPEQRA